MKSFSFTIVFLLIYHIHAQQNERNFVKIEESNNNGGVSQFVAPKSTIGSKIYKFKYRSESYKGTRLEITSKLRALKNDSKFAGIPSEIKTVLNELFKNTKHQAIPRLYKKNAIIFLDALYSYEEFVITYDNSLHEVVGKIKTDMRYIDFKFERQFTKAKVKLDRVIKENPESTKEIDRLEKDARNSLIKLISHRWMKKKFETYKGIDIVKKPDALIKEFKETEAMNAFNLFQEKEIEKMSPYLENQIIDFFYKKSIPEIHPDQLELNYIDKI
ncbi:hypothetical protein [Aquimarina aggregata]|uniref:hypothetical protein n=1 Tax=Aquimarina aggregata TaxID=1642818 RepID=UPI00248FD8FB|nr:hypothetical protein [Aquimarina aggregata]